MEVTVPHRDKLTKLIQNKLVHIFCISALISFSVPTLFYLSAAQFPQVAPAAIEENYWLLLHRKSNKEFLYFGRPGEEKQSVLIKEFRVKTGVPGERPTPLPQLLGREYWLIVDELDSRDNPETAPFFLTLDIPISESAPYGPTPYNECNESDGSDLTGQCNWKLPGHFGLHGVAGDPSRLEETNEGSSGCIRHTDKDIIYLTRLLNPQENPVRYYIMNI